MQQLLTLEFWISALESFRNTGLLAPVLLAALESVLPPLPLIAIVTLNVGTYGPFLGGFLSWAGTCLGCTVMFLAYRFLLRRPMERLSGTHARIRSARAWVGSIGTPVLFTILILPFTPSSFINFAFGVSEYPVRKYLPTLYLAKLIMISLLALFGESVVYAFEKPVMIVCSVALVVGMYLLSRKVSRKAGIPNSQQSEEKL